MRKSKTADKTALVLAVLGSLIALNVLGLGLFGRLDLTRNKEFTLGKATRDVLDNLQEPVTIRAYFTKDLPPPYSTNARYVKDLLDEYYTHSHGKFRYEFIDPAGEESQEEKDKKKDVKVDIFGRPVREMTKVEQELAGLGIPPVQVQVNEDDKVEVKRAYMGLAVKALDKSDAIPVVEDTSGLEYDLTTLIRKMTRTKTPKIGFLVGHDGPALDKELTRATGMLGQIYDLTPVDLTQNATIAEDVDSLLIVGPRTELSEAEKRAIDAFIMAGHSVAFLLDAVKPDLQNLQTADTAHGLNDMLARYGVRVQPGLVLDAESATITVSQQRGHMRVQQPVRYPFMPVPQNLDAEHPLTRGLRQVAFAFMSPLSVDNSVQDVKVEPLVKSSLNAGVQLPPYNLDPLQQWTGESIKDRGEKALVIAVSGPIKSFFGDAAAAQNARILVAGGSTFITDELFSKPNEAFLLNLIDWLVLDEGLLAMRARGLTAAPLADVGDAKRSAIKYFNTLGLPLLLVGAGMIHWRARERRRRTVSL